MPKTSRRVRTVGVACGLALALAGCKPAKTDQQLPPPPLVTVIKPGSTPVQEYREYNGHLDAVEMVEIRARVKGFLEEVLFKEGEEVAAKAPLYKIDPREFASAVAKAKSDIARAVADIASAKAQVQLAEAELSRLQAGGTSISKSEMDKAVATLAANKAQMDVADANKGSAEAAQRTAELQLGYTDIKAPIGGRISRTLVTRGNLVGGTTADTLLTTIVSVEELFVYFDAPERDLVQYQQEQKDRPAASATNGNLAVEVGVATETGFPHPGKIDFRENKVDTGTGTVRLRGRIPNPLVPPGNVRLLYPGLFAKVRVPVGEKKPQFVIPEDALMTGQEGRYVYVIGPENKVMKRTVTVGPQVWRAPPPDPDKKANGWALAPIKPGADGKTPPPAAVRSVIAILQGLTADDVVIVNGLQKVRPGAPATPDVWELKGPK
jgi:RND family efflux transporter MFP subunit